TGAPELRPVVGRVVADSIASRAGLRYEDEIVRIDGRAVTNHADVIFGLIDAMSSDGTADLQVQRNGAPIDLQLQVPDAEVRRALTEPSVLLPGLGFRFWSPPMPASIGRLTEGGPAALAGLRAGDRIVAIDGEVVADFPALAELVADRPNRDVRVEYLRDGVPGVVTVRTSSELVQGRERGRMRIETPPPPPWPADMVRQRSFGFFEASFVACERAWDMSVMQARMLARMLIGQVSLKNLSGPLSIAEYAGQSASSGLNEFLGFLIVISLSLGFLNLLPIPILDGGQILYQLAEWIKGSPLSDAVQSIGQQVGLLLLLLLMGVALFNDVARQLG
ncbi:MAG: RIP metalloprotease RseP, partial [Gammaproteobacteria bacterium]|nr:RIP metalloprotease RseP [Gammaproteobacteria bacterium]